MYRSTPHTITGKSPAELFFNRKIRDSLPAIRKCVEIPEVRDRNNSSKAKSFALEKNVPQKRYYCGKQSSNKTTV